MFWVGSLSFVVSVEKKRGVVVVLEAAQGEEKDDDRTDADAACQVKVLREDVAATVAVARRA